MKNDGTTYETAGAKAGNGEGDEYEEETEDLIATHEDELAPMEGPGAEHMQEHSDDEEKLLDDSENDPTAEAPTSDPSVGKNVPIGVHSTLSDPDPEVSGADPIDVEGEETNEDSAEVCDSDADEDELENE